MNPTPALLATCLLTAACLENEERIEVRPDGSIRIEISASGDAEDLTLGHSVPLWGPWQAVDPLTRAWVAEVGGATGGQELRAKFDGGGATRIAGLDVSDVTLRAAAEFASVDELPRFLAPASEPYASALLERRTTLSIEHKGPRTIYSFERRYPGRPFFDSFDPDRIPADVTARLDAEQALSEDQVQRVAELAREHGHTDAVQGLFTSAVAAIYTEGDASLSTPAFERVVARLDAMIDEVFTPANVRAFFDALHTAQLDPGTPIPEQLDLERRLFDAARRCIAEALEAEQVEAEVRHAMLERLEWNLTSFALAKDLADESFSVHVELPGTVVSGNFDRLVDGRATWEFDGERLFGADRTLRVVSVLD